MSEYKNEIGDPMSDRDYDEMLEQMKVLEHILPLSVGDNGHKVFCDSTLRGRFFGNLVSGENYVVSEYGISKFEKSGLVWSIQNKKAIQKFMNINQQISNKYAPQPEEEIMKTKIQRKLGL